MSLAAAPLPRVLVVTTMSAEGYAQTGERMIDAAGRLWGEGIRLRCYAERFKVQDRQGFVDWRDLDEAAPWLRPFKARCAEVPLQCGLGTPGAYDFRYDARKFACKVAALTAAGLELAGRNPPPGRLSLPEVLIWLDADTVTHAPVTADWLCAFIRPDSLLAWLDRVKLYPECGLVMFRPYHPDFAGLMLSLQDCYARDRVFRMREWHDSYVLQQLMHPLLVREVKVDSLSGNARRHPHPFINGPLGARFDHMKGPRKAAGRSAKADLSWPRPEDWWNV